MKPFRKIQTDDKTLNRLQDHISEVFGQFLSNPLLGGKIMLAVPLANGTNTVAHGLGRNYVSFLSGNHTGPARLSAGTSPDRSRFVAIVSDAAISADLYLY